jgi:hypothetical protein
VTDTLASVPDIKSKTGRPPRRASEKNAQDVRYFLSRWQRYGRQAGHNGKRLDPFAIALAIWREFTQARAPSPVLANLSAYRHARLEEDFADAEEELDERLSRVPRPSELASLVASWYPSRDPVRSTAMKKLERLSDEAKAGEYWSGVPAQYIPYTGLRPSKQGAEAFWRWYNATFHGH